MPMMGPSVSTGSIPSGQPASMSNKPLFPSAAAIVCLTCFGHTYLYNFCRILCFRPVILMLVPIVLCYLEDPLVA